MSKVPVNLETSKGTGVLHNQVIRANGLVYCSGQIPADLVTGDIVDGDIKQHTHQCIQNLKAVLEAAGSSLEKVVKVNVFIIDMKNFALMNEVYTQYWGEVKPMHWGTEFTTWSGCGNRMYGVGGEGVSIIEYLEIYIMLWKP
ncbi:2-iminobutanoate/2-iminopropanoate deaminase [Lachnellula suecica]|uniref:2-iminobutanoate/2-iminopropanoate deaminase n=1 Tax=Lachnellula suecica TaxID=602035 RepID=A0A8T9C9S1_9HELO|nr:2-iminobutanoate/2-iminopropanoate deaminase [Lachnellula suecica]